MIASLEVAGRVLRGRAVPDAPQMMIAAEDAAIFAAAYPRASFEQGEAGSAGAPEGPAAASAAGRAGAAEPRPGRPEVRAPAPLPTRPIPAHGVHSQLLHDAGRWV